MRLGTVIGRVTLTLKEPVYSAGSLLIVQPFTREQFAAAARAMPKTAPQSPLAPGSSLVVFDELGATIGSVIGFTEGAEASQPFEGDAPVDAYCACLVDQVDYQPPR
jgi:microcompartment protein CcmK/EutM